MKLPSFLSRLIPLNWAKTAPEASSKRPYAVAQIELTSRCTTGCRFCPHDALVDTWQSGEMPYELFASQIAPYLDLFELVYLQGWGEPMLHPDLWAIISLAQQKGCNTGFTTNGKWLTPENNERLLDQGVGLISVSFAGATPEMHTSLRTHSVFEDLSRNFSDLANRKRQRGLDRPWLELHFLMTRLNLQELPALVGLAAELGADEMVATNLTYSPTLELDRLHVFADEPDPDHLAILEEAHHTAKRLGIRLRTYPIKTHPRTLVCDADPMRSIYINHRGEVTACVYLGITLQTAVGQREQGGGIIPRYYQGEWKPIVLKDVSQPGYPASHQFGNVREGLRTVLEGPGRAEFVQAFQRRNIASNPLISFSYLAGTTGETELPPPPEPCRACYKMLGV